MQTHARPTAELPSPQPAAHTTALPSPSLSLPSSPAKTPSAQNYLPAAPAPAPMATTGAGSAAAPAQVPVEGGHQPMLLDPFDGGMSLEWDFSELNAPQAPTA